ncbi:hypothetical protein B0H14DRAFT_2633769 [Mycena olivaceomarginata]|nr:hypothetical protein B0H14DRAFT_2633769 [Mycena olivaceomarginata]
MLMLLEEAHHLSSDLLTGACLIVTSQVPLYRQFNEILRTFPNFGRSMRLQPAITFHVIALLHAIFAFMGHQAILAKTSYITPHIIWRVSNNQVDTVLNLFQGTMARYGLSSCVQGEYGTENVLVAMMIEDECGVKHGCTYGAGHTGVGKGLELSQPSDLWIVPGGLERLC